MKFTIEKRYWNFRRVIFYEVEIECKGNGTKEKPIIIENLEHQPYQFRIINSKQHILIRNLKFIGVNSYLNLHRCENITIENCIFNFCSLKSCFNINIKNSTFRIALGLSFVFDSNISESKIARLYLSRCFRNNISNCIILKIKKNSLKWNNYEGNKIQKIISSFSLNHAMIENKSHIAFLLTILFSIISVITIIFIFGENLLIILITVGVIALIAYLIYRFFYEEKEPKFQFNNI